MMKIRDWILLPVKIFLALIVLIVWAVWEILFPDYEEDWLERGFTE